MQENEFEKQVKNMMERFKATPSHAAWEKVSRRIHADKRKKKYLIFLLLAGLITAGYFSYTVLEKNKENSKVYTAEKKSSAVEKSLSKDSKQANNKTVVADTLLMNNKKNVAENAKQNKFYKPVDVVNNKQVLLQQHSITDNLNANNKANKNDVLPFQHVTSLSKENVDPNNINIQLARTDSIASENNKQVYSDSSLITDPSSIETATSNFNALQPSIEKSNDKNFMQVDSANQLQKNIDNTSKTITKKLSTLKIKIPNWRFGITAFYGRSDLVQHLVSFNKSSSLDYVSGPLIIPSNSNPDSSQATLNVHNSYTSSQAFHIGAIVQKKITKNAVVGIGLNFTKLSAKSMISKQINTVTYVPNGNGFGNFRVESFYQPGNSSAYINNFNFIEMPVYFQQDIFYASKISFAYNAGFSIRRLLSSNALIYDSRNNIYFSKNNLFYKTQFQFLAGLKLNFNTNKNSSFFIAPQFQYNFSGLLKEGNGSNYHLINYGLQAGFLLNKK